MNKKYDWTKEMDERLMAEYPDKRSDILAKEIGVPLYTLYNRAYKFGLKKSVAFLNSEDCGRLVKGSTRKEGIRHQYKKGHIPTNKGKKQIEYMTPEGIEKTKATRFQKGQLPTNTLHNYAITQRTDSKGRTYK